MIIDTLRNINPDIRKLSRFAQLLSQICRIQELRNGIHVIVMRRSVAWSHETGIAYVQDASFGVLSNRQGSIKKIATNSEEGKETGKDRRHIRLLCW